VAALFCTSGSRSGCRRPTVFANRSNHTTCRFYRRNCRMSTQNSLSHCVSTGLLRFFLKCGQLQPQTPGFSTVTA
jgi:hypothetical protein